MRSEVIRQNVISSLREGADLHLRLIEHCGEAIIEATKAVCASLERGGKVLLFGNGGSAADSQHIAAEFVGRFSRERNPLPAIALTTDTSALTAIGNDYGFDQIFARQLRALGRKGDVAIAISTSGRSQNVLVAVEAALDRDITVIGLAGRDGGRLGELADIAIIVPSTDTARIQECHLTIEHIICDNVETVIGELR